MVPIKEAISSGSWLQCEYKRFQEEYKFRIKINSFRQLSLSEIDSPEKIQNLDNSATLWIMAIEFVNLTKKPIHPTYGPPSLILIDQDDFSFHLFEDYHLENGSNFSIKTGMNRFHSAELIPKVKAIGSLVFQLPNDDDAIYSLSIKENGLVQEV